MKETPDSTFPVVFAIALQLLDAPVAVVYFGYAVAFIALAVDTWQIFAQYKAQCAALS